MPRPAPAVGERIREERLKRGVSLRALARLVGVSASLISQIETGKSQPSVSTLYAITNALEVSIEDVFESADGVAIESNVGSNLGTNLATNADRHVETNHAAPPTVPSMAALLGSAREVHLGPLVGPDQRERLELDSGVTWERLGYVPGAKVDFLLITYPPGSSSSSTGQLMRHPGTEYGYLLQGELTVTLGFEEFRLRMGDSVCFPSATPHRYRNDGDQAAVGVWFVSEPDL